MKRAVEDLFTYDASHFVMPGYHIFDNAKLVRDIGKFKAGAVLPAIHIQGIRLTIIEDDTDPAFPSGKDHNFTLKYSL